MALYTHLTKKQITKLAAPFSLAPPKKVKGILEGTVNTYYQLTYPNKTCFLKIDEVGDLKRLIKELKILSALSQKQKKLGYHTPIPLRSTKGKFYQPFQKKFVLLFDKIPGKWIKSSSLNKNHLSRIGQALAKIHNVRTSRGLSLHRFDLKEQEKVYRQIQNKLRRKHPTVDLEIRQWLGWIKKNEPKSIPSGLIHADLFPENIHFGGGKIQGILDFEAAGKGAYLFDIATTLHACCYFKKTFSLTKAKSFLKGYQSIRKLQPKEEKCLEYYLFQSNLRFLLTRLRDFELKEGKVKAKPFKDYREFLRRFSEIPEFVEKLL